MNKRVQRCTVRVPRSVGGVGEEGSCAVCDKRAGREIEEGNGRGYSHRTLKVVVLMI